MALVPDAHVAEGDGRGDVATNTARPGAALGQPPACWHLRPLRRLTLFKGETAAGRPQIVGVDWWGRVWDNDTARQPPPPPNPGAAATWLDVANAVHTLLPLVTDVCWATVPQPGEIHATVRWPDDLRRVDPRIQRDLLHEVAQEARRLAGGWEHGHPPRTPAPPPPCRLPKAGRRLPLRRPLHHQLRLPRAGDRRQPPDHGAAGPEAEINLKACFAAPLAPPFAPSDH